METLRHLAAQYARPRRAPLANRPGPDDDDAPPVLAYVGRDVPREVILAAGLMPLRLPGVVGDHEPGDRFCGPGIDEVARSQLSRILGGELAGCAALAIGADCEASVRLFLYLREVQRLEPFPGVPPFTIVDFGHLPRPSTAAYNRVRLDEFIAQVADWAGRPITDDDLTRAVHTMNESRRLIRAIGRLRAGEAGRSHGGQPLGAAGGQPLRAAAGEPLGAAAGQPRGAAGGPLLSGADALRCTGAGFALPPIVFQAQLRKLLDEARGAAPLPGVRVFLTGSNHDHPAAYDLIESRGAVIVGEDHDWGALAGESDVDEDAPVRDAIVAAYWQGAPVAPRYGIRERAEQTARLVARSGAELVIAWLREHDPAAAWDVCGQRAALAELGVPLLVLPAQPYAATPDDAVLARLDEALAAAIPAGGRR